MVRLGGAVGLDGASPDGEGSGEGDGLGLGDGEGLTLGLAARLGLGEGDVAEVPIEGLRDGDAIVVQAVRTASAVATRVPSRRT